jgi:hypothetical protein
MKEIKFAVSFKRLGHSSSQILSAAFFFKASQSLCGSFSSFIFIDAEVSICLFGSY